MFRVRYEPMGIPTCVEDLSMGNHLTPKQRSQAVLDYFEKNFSVINGVVTRGDGYTGRSCNGYKSFHVPNYISGRKDDWAYAHHISWFLSTGKWPLYELDHWVDKKNNSFSNLREVKGTNRKEQNDYYSDWGKGYSLYKGKYSCFIYGNDKQRYLGRARTESEAIRKVALARISLLNDWDDEPFADSKPFQFYAGHRCEKLIARKVKHSYAVRAT